MDEGDRELVRSGLEKRRAGQKLTQREARAVKNFEAEQLERQRDAIVRNIPKGVYCSWAGAQPKVINEQADRYRLPLRGRTVDLIEVIRRQHEFLSENHRKLRSDDSDDPLLAGASSHALEGYRWEKCRQARLDRLEQEGRLVRCDDVLARLNAIASIIRQAGENLRKQHGDEAADIIETALEDCESEIEAFGPGRDLYEEDGAPEIPPPQ